MQNVEQDGLTDWLVETEESLVRRVRESQVFRLVQASTVLHCRVKSAPALDISTLPYRENIAGTFVWEGDRESPV